MTVRQVFYQLVTRAVIDKTEQEYKGTVCRLLAKMRRSGDLPYEWIADNSRWMRKPTSYGSIEELLETTRQAYRRSLWANQDAYVEVWIEKEALAGVVYELTSRWDVPLMVTRGYPSLTFLYEAAEQMPLDRVVYIYYLGDFDPSGVDIERFVREQLDDLRLGRLVREHISDKPDPTALTAAFEMLTRISGLFEEEKPSDLDDLVSRFERAGVPFHRELDIEFDRLAVSADQIVEYSLPTRPTKKSDSRSKGFTGESVELDALSTSQLHELVETAITQHLDKGQLDRTLKIEEQEQKSLEEFLGRWEGKTA